MSFITDEDYSVLIRREIKTVLLENYSDTKLKGAEDMAIAQIKNYIRGFYDTDKIFSAVEDQRNAFVVMITIDCALYHLYTSLAPNKIPQHRTDRYTDALEWLKGIADGKKADLPPIVDGETGKPKSTIRIVSEYSKQNNKW
ncbi:phage protein Gp36 family protein [Empedobacter brevis]|uniref:phage protein Gp36 family protein n=1 Tax=Empedobacter brevis TaxID=247 RepID=UPI0028976694|nr:phage protein Gp36 family protein [Empedobacter brevis]